MGMAASTKDEGLERGKHLFAEGGAAWDCKRGRDRRFMRGPCPTCERDTLQVKGECVHCHIKAAVERTPDRKYLMSYGSGHKRKRKE